MKGTGQIDRNQTTTKHKQSTNRVHISQDALHIEDTNDPEKSGTITFAFTVHSCVSLLPVMLTTYKQV